ncbi:MAG: hypothetical protein OXQ27_13275 [Chloroflexota bacterium]|nr:hypothetical protein [Chloroflexota bacterium]
MANARPSLATRLGSWIRVITLALALIGVAAGVAALALGVFLWRDRPTIQTAADQAQNAAQVTSVIDTRVSGLEQQAEALSQQVSVLQFQNHLLRASVRVSRARAHLREQEGGLAIRELAEVDRSLAAAAKLGSAGQQEQIAEIKTLLADLKNIIETGTFPIQTLEVVGDRIDGMIR